MTVKVNNKEFYFDGYVNPLNSVQKLAEECYRQGGVDTIDEIIEYYKPCNECCACLEEDRDYFKKKCEMDMQISYAELVEDLEQLKEQK